MTDLQKQLLRQHEIRSRMREIAAGEQTDETKSETATLLSELGEIEQRATALQVAEDLDPNRGEIENDGAGDPALARLVEQATVGEVLTASIEHRATAGATRELQEHYGMAGNMVPLDLLMMGAGGAGIEHRTTGVTPGGTETGAAQRPIVPAVFPASAASYLGINPEMVPTGDAVWPVLSTSASPGTPAKGAEQAHSTGAFTVAVLSPKRIQASLFFGLEDQARFAGMEEALRLNLSDALADQLDDEVLNGADGGLFVGTKLDNNNTSTADDYASYRKRFVFDRIDGKYASMAGDLRVLVGADTYGDMAASYRGNNDNTDALTALMRDTGGVRVSAHVPVTASSRQNGVVRLGMRRDYACGLWRGVTIIRDEITQAKAGEVVLTAVMLYACKILRAAGFAKVQAQHS